MLFLIAWVSPANNVDSQIYHMGRVVHWAQNHSLRAYAATNFGQNTKPVWAEAAILNLRVLWGTDRPANLVQWFVYCLIVGVFTAYVAGRALEPGAHYLAVFRMAGVTTFAGYGLALLQNSIWYKRNWPSTLKSVFDALIYGLVTAGVFGWLWPA